MTFQSIDKRSVVVDGHKTSISVEKCYWGQIKRIADERDLGVGALIAQVASYQPQNLSSALRQIVLADLLARADFTLPVHAVSLSWLMMEG